MVDDEDFDCLDGYEKVDEEQFGSIMARIPDKHERLHVDSCP